MSGWQDIASAPKDGSQFLATGFNFGNPRHGRHTTIAMWGHPLNGGRDGFWEPNGDEAQLTHLTHWMPLPPTPEQPASIGEGL